MKAKSPLSSRFSNLATAGLVAGSLLAASPAAKGQSVINANETFGWSTIFTVADDASVFYPGATGTGTLTLNPSTLSQVAGANIWDATASISYNVAYNGNSIAYNYSDLQIVFAPGSDGISIAWNGMADDLAFNLTNPSNLPGQAGIQADLLSIANGEYATTIQSSLSDAAGVYGGQGPVTSFQMEATPEPGTLALGGLGAAALAAARLRSRIKQPCALKTVGLNAGM